MRFPRYRGRLGLLTLVVLTSCCLRANAQPASPEALAGLVADRIVEDTFFSFVLDAEAARQEGVYHIDFADALGWAEDAVYYAASTLLASGDAPRRGLRLGISHSPGSAEVRLGGDVIYRDTRTATHGALPLDYAIHDFDAVVDLPALDDEGTLSIKLAPGGPQAAVYLAILRQDRQHERGVQLVPPITHTERASELAVCCALIGPFPARGHGIDARHGPDAEAPQPLATYPGTGGEMLRWTLPRRGLVTELNDPLDLSDWRYFTGTFLDAMAAVSRTFPALDYQRYIDAHLDFFFDHREAIATEREALNLRHSPFGHYFRFQLLDDVGMQAVPIVERLRQRGRSRAAAEWELASRVARHIMDDVPRLADGTFGRLNPDSLTVWADDLYMGSVFLVRFSELTGEQRYLDEAIRQSRLFHTHLFDPETGLYFHGWFDAQQQPSSSRWARANGWVMMARTELLLALAPDDPRRAEVLSDFRAHAYGILRTQSAEGRWHQVLNNPDTYLETSATAMFVRAFAEGLHRDWLVEPTAPSAADEILRFRRAIEQGWAAVLRQVRDDGRVEGIVRGTPIMFSDREYDRHPTRLNDPRGLGAVLFAAVAMQNLLEAEAVRSTSP